MATLVTLCSVLSWLFLILWFERKEVVNAIGVRGDEFVGTLPFYHLRRQKVARPSSQCFFLTKGPAFHVTAIIGFLTGQSLGFRV